MTFTRRVRPGDFCQLDSAAHPQSALVPSLAGLPHPPLACPTTLLHDAVAASTYLTFFSSSSCRSNTLVLPADTSTLCPSPSLHPPTTSANPPPKHAPKNNTHPPLSATSPLPPPLPPLPLLPSNHLLPPLLGPRCTVQSSVWLRNAAALDSSSLQSAPHCTTKPALASYTPSPPGPSQSPPTWSWEPSVHSKSPIRPRARAPIPSSSRPRARATRAAPTAFVTPNSTNG